MNRYPFRFFGPGRIVDAHGNPVRIRSRKQLALLAYLATEHAVVHSRETLRTLFWPDQETSAALNNLRVTLSRLRQLAPKLAAPDAARPALLIADRHHVQIHPAWIERADTNRFHRLLERSRQHGHASRSQCAHCQTLLREAVQLHRGEFLAGFGLAECNIFEEWLFMQRERLRLLILDAYTDLAAYAETSGDLAGACTAAQRQIELDPLRESAYRQQMRILATQGDRNAALALFERCRTLLRDELGLDPQPETLALHTEILNAGMLTTASATHADAVPPRHNLLPQLTPFIGREGELEELRARLTGQRYRLLSIVGPGGIGKSRLAQHAAAQQLNNFRNGVYFVSLAQVPAAESIPLAIAETLGLPFGDGHKSPAEQIFEMIAHKQLLLVLDNFEHLMDGVDLLVALLQQAPEAVLLVTSRERLNVQAEDLFELHGLAVPTSGTDASAAQFSAVRLFVDRARRQEKRFRLTAADLPHVVRICQLVEGFPLAIELAATSIRDLNCGEIAAELVAGLDRLETTARDVDPQHRTLRAVFNTSWQLLAMPEQRTLSKLSVFRGGFTLDAACTVADATPSLLNALRNKSLLRRAGSRRYDMHALVQQFSAEALAGDPAAAAQVQRAHCQCYLTMLADEAVALDTNAAGVASARIQPEWENVTVAWQWATAHMDHLLLLGALNGLHIFCDLHGLYPEAQALLESTVTRLEMLRTAATETGRNQDETAAAMQRAKLHCRLLTALIYVAECRGQFERTQEFAQRALEIATELGSHTEIIHIHVGRAQAFETVADYAQGLALAQKMLEMAQAEGLSIQAGICMELIGYNAYRLGDYAQSQAMYQRLLAFHEQSGRLGLRVRLALSILGSIAIAQGEYEMGLTYYQRFLESSQATGDRVNTAHAYDYLASAWNHLGDYARAIAMADQSIVRGDVLGDSRIKRLALLSRSYAQRQQGKFATALLDVTEAVAVARRIGSPIALTNSLAHLAETQAALAQSEAEREEAAAHFREAATRLRANNEMIPAYEAEIGLANLTYRRGALPEALSQITPIIAHLPTTNADGWDEPIRAYVVCARLLQVTDAPAAEALIDQGLHLLHCLAQKITDYARRQTFLNAVPAHRALRAARGSLAVKRG